MGDTAVAEPGVIEGQVAGEQAAEEQDGAAVEGAEATHTTEHLFAYSRKVNVGVGAEGVPAAECPLAETGQCADANHFHGWVCLPNPLQQKDILEKARAAKARKRRAMRDAGDVNRAASDAYVSLESDLDDLLRGDRERLIGELADREVRQGAVKRIGEVQEGDERFENYWQDREEWERLAYMPEEERPAEEFQTLERSMEDFEQALEKRAEQDRERQMSAMRGMTDEAFREQLRSVRIEGESAEAHLATYYVWMGFIGTRRQTATAKRYFEKLEDYRTAPPEVIEAIEDTLRDLESRMQRGEAAGN